MKKSAVKTVKLNRNYNEVLEDVVKKAGRQRLACQCTVQFST